MVSDLEESGEVMDQKRGQGDYWVPLEACPQPMKQEAQRPSNKNITNSRENIYSEGKRLDRNFSIFVWEGWVKVE